jgi:hypothetical protein
MNSGLVEMHKPDARFIVVGDSHSSFFSGENAIVKDFKESNLYGMNFHVYHLGPVLAASLVERQSTLMAREKALDILRREKPASWDGVVFVFGEIDYRYHIIKRLGHQNATLTSNVSRSITITALRYFSFLHEVVLLGHKPIVWGPIASNCLVVTNPDWPNYGTTRERNIITQEFSKQLASLCERNGMYFASLLPELLTETMDTREDFYFDGGHLGLQAWSAALPLFLNSLRHAQFHTARHAPQEGGSGIDDNDIEKYLALINQS